MQNGFGRQGMNFFQQQSAAVMNRFQQQQNMVAAQAVAAQQNRGVWQSVPQPYRQQIQSSTVPQPFNNNPVQSRLGPATTAQATRTPVTAPAKSEGSRPVQLLRPGQDKQNTTANKPEDKSSSPTVNKNAAPQVNVEAKSNSALASSGTNSSNKPNEMASSTTKTVTPAAQKQSSVGASAAPPPLMSSTSNASRGFNQQKPAFTTQQNTSVSSTTATDRVVTSLGPVVQSSASTANKVDLKPAAANDKSNKKPEPIQFGASGSNSKSFSGSNNQNLTKGNAQNKPESEEKSLPHQVNQPPQNHPNTNSNKFAQQRRFGSQNDRSSNQHGMEAQSGNENRSQGSSRFNNFSSSNDSRGKQSGNKSNQGSGRDASPNTKFSGPGSKAANQNDSSGSSNQKSKQGGQDESHFRSNQGHDSSDYGSNKHKSGSSNHGNVSHAEGGRAGMGNRDFRREGGRGRGGFTQEKFWDRVQEIAGPQYDLDPIDMSEKKFNAQSRLFVGSLPRDITLEELKEMFSKFGELGQVYFNKDGAYAFINFDYHINSEKAMRELNGTQLRGRALKVRFAAITTGVRVKNLPVTVTNELLFKAFSVFGPVEASRVIVDDRGKPTGDGIIIFTEKKSAVMAYKKCQEESYFITSQLRPVIVEPWETRDDEEGYPEANITKNDIYKKDRKTGPRFAEPNSFESDYGKRWKQLFDIYKEKKISLENDLKAEMEALEVKMQLVVHQQETEKLRKELAQREQEAMQLQMGLGAYADGNRPPTQLSAGVIDDYGPPSYSGLKRPHDYYDTQMIDQQARYDQSRGSYDDYYRYDRREEHASGAGAYGRGGAAYGYDREGAPMDRGMRSLDTAAAERGMERPADRPLGHGMDRGVRSNDHRMSGSLAPVATDVVAGAAKPNTPSNPYEQAQQQQQYERKPAAEPYTASPQADGYNRTENAANPSHANPSHANPYEGGHSGTSPYEASHKRGRY